ncbi:Protein dispatched [Diplonema papillatum]|nr:Protein dispatched [Diplonema papillatum]
MYERSNPVAPPSQHAYNQPPGTYHQPPGSVNGSPGTAYNQVSWQPPKVNDFEHDYATQSPIPASGLEGKEVKTFVVTNFIADRPCVSMCSILLLFLITAFISFGVIGLEIESTELRDWGDSRTEKMDAIDRVIEMIEEKPQDAEGHEQHYRSVTADQFSLIYKQEDGAAGPIFTVKNVRQMYSVESRLRRSANFKHYCRLTWFPAGADCPGTACPWYIAEWDVTKDALLQDGTRLVCSDPVQRSASWFLYNMLWALPDGTACTEAAMQTDAGLRDRCLSEAMPTYRDQAVLEQGGVEPTAFDLEFFLQVAQRIIETVDPRGPALSYLSLYFSKKTGAAFGTDVTRGIVHLGGPIEYVDPKDHLPCHVNTGDQTTCEAIAGCHWSKYAGFNMSTVGCAPRQYDLISKSKDAPLNEDQVNEVADRFSRDFLSFFNDEAQDGDIDVLFSNSGIAGEQFTDVLLRDSLLSLVSFMFVYLYVQIHTSSFFLASLGMLQVLMPFPIAYFLYFTVFQVKGFYAFSTLSIYIMLAIGADDIFVFFDNWQQAGEYYGADNVDIKTRLCRAWKIAGSAMAVTSVTTTAAFVASMTSPLIEISTFGLFAALLVMLDYILCMTFFAAALVYYHSSFEYTLGCCCCGQNAFGSWCNCCTCYTALLPMSSEFKPTCMQSKLSKKRTCKTLAEAEERRAADSSIEAMAHYNKRMSVQDTTDATGDPEYKKRRIVGFVCLGLAAVVYGVGYAGLHSDHSSGNSYLFWTLLLIIGLFFFCGGISALSAASAHIAEAARKRGVTPPSSFNHFVKHTVAPFISGMAMPDDTQMRSGKPEPPVSFITSNTFASNAVRLALPGMLVIACTVMIVGATNLGATTKIDQWLPDWHPFQRYFFSITNDFRANAQDQTVPVRLVFGLDADSPIDRDGVDEYDPDTVGEPTFWSAPAKQTAFNSAGFQTFAMEVCARILSASRAGKLIQRTLLDTGREDQNCIITNLAEWRDASNLPFPVPSDQFVATLWQFVQESSQNRSSLQSFTPRSSIFDDKVLWVFGNGRDQAPTGIEVMYFEFNTTLKGNNAYEDIRDWYDEWEDISDAMNNPNTDWVAAAYAGEENLWSNRIFHASEMWMRMHVQKVLVNGAFQGTFISLGLAAFFVLVSTLNFLVSLFVVLELVGAVGCVMGFIYYAGWEMGMIESVSVTLLVGISVDYVVHYAIHYAHVKPPGASVLALATPGATERKYRVYRTVIEMGPTVLGGAATSCGAAMVLFCTWVQFFYKFGAIFLATIVFSFIWALFFFLPMLSYFGPQGTFASLRPLLRRCLPCLAKDDDAPDEIQYSTPTSPVKGAYNPPDVAEQPANGYPVNGNGNGNGKLHDDGYVSAKKTTSAQYISDMQTFKFPADVDQSEQRDQRSYHGINDTRLGSQGSPGYRPAPDVAHSLRSSKQPSPYYPSLNNELSVPLNLQGQQPHGTQRYYAPATAHPQQQQSSRARYPAVSNMLTL